MIYSMARPTVSARRPVAAPFEELHRVPGGDRLVQRVARSADVRRGGLMARALRATGLVGAPLPTFWSWGFGNFGDMLAPATLAYASGATPTLANRHSQGKVLACGSILHFIQPHDVVWGSGMLHGRLLRPPRSSRILAVRGPRTRAMIEGEVPDVLGDPAILLPYFYRPVVRRRYDIGVVPHYDDADAVDVQDPSVLVIDVFDDWRKVVDAIASCDVIVSSSLHGLIVAEAYGIAAVWAVITGDLEGKEFKFMDYYESTGREAPEPARWRQGMRRAVSGATEPPTLDGDALIQAWEEYAGENVPWRGSTSGSA